jgi:hypothetical protein
MKKNPFIISENDRRHIMSLYGILTEEEKEYVIAGVLIGDDTEKAVELAKVTIMDGKTPLKGAGTLSGTDGGFEIKTKLDNLKTYTIKITAPSGYLVYESPLDMTNLNQKLNITLVSTGKDLQEVSVDAAAPNSQKVFFKTEFVINFKDSQDNNISDVKIIGVKLPSNNKIIKIDSKNTNETGSTIISLNHSEFDLGFKTLDKDKKEVDDFNPKQENKIFEVFYKKNKYKSSEKIDVISPTKKILLFGYLGVKKNEKIKDKEEFIQENLYVVCYGNTAEVKKDLSSEGSIVTLNNFKQNKSLKDQINPELKKLGYDEVKTRRRTLKETDKVLAEKVNSFNFDDYGTQNETKTIELETFLDIQIEVVNKNNNRIPNAKVEVYTDKQKTNLITTEYTDEEGVIKTKVNLLDAESEDDELSNKSKIWLEITKKGYDDYFQKFLVSRDNFIISASLNDFSYTPDVVNTDYKKETTFFRFVGKNSYDIKGQLDGDYDMAEKRAKNDALMQFLKSSKKYRNNKKLIEALSYKIPDGGKVVYKRKYSNGYYAIVEMSRRELNRFVKSFINANTKENENQKIEFFNFNFTNTLKSLNEEFPGSVIAVFYYVDYKYISELEKNQSVVERLNGGNFSLKVNENTPDKSAIATFFNFTTTNKIAIVDANQNILLNQTIYSNNDINFVAEKINKLLTK